MKALFYHATPYKSLYSVAHNGLRPSEDGYVKLCRSVVDAVCFGQHKDVGDSDCFVVLTVFLDLEDVERFSEQPPSSVVPIPCHRYKGWIPPSCIALSDSDIERFHY